MSFAACRRSFLSLTLRQYSRCLTFHSATMTAKSKVILLLLLILLFNFLFYIGFTTGQIKEMTYKSASSGYNIDHAGTQENRSLFNDDDDDKNTTTVIAPQFCRNCLFNPQTLRGVSCLQRAHYLAARYNLSTLEAFDAVLEAEPLNCAQKDRRHDEGVPGVTDVTAWCILGGNNTPPKQWVAGFSHSAQALIPCWSYFSRVREVVPTAHCAIWFQSPQAEMFHYKWTKKRGDWVSDLLTSMNCTYGFGEDYPPPNATWYFRPQNLDYDEWFQRPSDATLLAGAVLGDAAIGSMDSTVRHQLRIGLVQRKGQRRNITNLPEIQQRIREDYPSALIEWGEMEDMPLFEQASFWNRQDVIVAAHGAAMTNVMFMRRNTAVVEIFPLHYYIFMYRMLCETINVHHFAWLDDIEDPEKDFQKHAKNRQVRFQLRANPLTPPADRIMGLVHQAVSITKRMHG